MGKWEGWASGPGAREIILANAAALAFALWAEDGLALMLWAYWAQSVLLGALNVGRILSLESFSAEGLKSNGKPVPETAAGKRSVAIFFALHYGFFHLIYAAFLGNMAKLDGEGWAWAAAGALGFLAAQRKAWGAWRETDKRGRTNIGMLMFFPYVRIVPMHLSIILGAGLMAAGAGFAAAALFAALKTAADLAGERLARSMELKSAERAERREVG